MLQGVQGRLEEASPAVQGRFHSMSGGAAHWFGDTDTAIEETVLALAVLADAPPSVERAMATASCGLTLAYSRLFPLAAEVLGQALAVGTEVGMPLARLARCQDACAESLHRAFCDRRRVRTRSTCNALGSWAICWKA